MNEGKPFDPREYVGTSLEDHQNLLNQCGVSPERAREQLNILFPFEDVAGVKKRVAIFKTGSHEVKALIKIAEGTETRLLGDVYMEVRVEDGLPPERDRAW